jgi:membrane-associated phospholipid phosphatase
MAWTKHRSLRLCFFVSTLLVWILLGSGLGTILSSAGPCYYSETVSASEDPFAPLVSKLNEIHEGNFLYAINNERLLWKAKLEGQWWPFGGISAMPSIHLAMAALFVLVAFDHNKWLGMFFVAYLFVIQIGSVILAWHYGIDGYAGIILAYVIWILVKRKVYKNAMPGALI